MKLKNKTETYCELAYAALGSAKGRIPASTLARAIGCSKQQVYFVIGVLRRMLEQTSKTTISSERGVGYRLAGMEGRGLVHDEQRANDVLSEATKSAQRGISQFHRQGSLLVTLKKEDLKDPDRIEEYALNIGVQANATALFAVESAIKQLMSRRARQLVGDAEEQAKAPAASFGLMSFRELLSAARAESDDKDDEES